MTTVTLTITDFLLARIAEDEAEARAAIDPARPGTHWQWVRTGDDVAVDAPTWHDMPVSLRTVEEFPTTSGVGDLPAFAVNSVEVDEPRALPHIARHDPARVLAECEAKRRIVEEHRRALVDNGCDTCADGAYVDHGDPVVDRLPWPCSTLRALASVYADHPDYREEWKP